MFASPLVGFFVRLLFECCFYDVQEVSKENFLWFDKWRETRAKKQKERLKLLELVRVEVIEFEIIKHLNRFFFSCEQKWNLSDGIIIGRWMDFFYQGKKMKKKCVWQDGWKNGESFRAEI